MIAPAAVRYRIKGTRVYVRPVSSPGARADGNLAYTAAGTSGRRAATWRASAIGPNAALSYSHATLVNRSREATRKNPLAESAVATIESNVVGTGIKPQWATSDSGLNREMAALWLEWTDEADADHRLDWYGLQALAVRSTVEAGEVFGRMRIRMPGDMATVPLQVQLLESEFCPADDFRQLRGREVRAGVEFDMVGRRTAYWMYRQHPADWSVSGMFDGITVPVPASEIAHVAQLRRPGQIRGEPWLTRALVKLRDLDKYDDAEVMRKQTAALFAGFITMAGGEDAFLGEGDADEDGVAVAAMQPGGLLKLKPGESVEFSEPADVGGTYEQFMRAQHRALAVAAGVMYEQLTGDYSTVNDRTFRASVNEFRRRARMWQHHMVVFQLCRPIVQRWMDLAVLSGAIVPPRGLDPRELTSRSVRWVPEGWSYIHPVQEVDAAVKAIRAGLKSRSQAVSESGENVEVIDEEIAADNARADALGLSFDSDGRRASGAPAKPDSAAAAGDDAADEGRREDA